MKSVFVLLCALSLTGCFQSVNSYDIARAIEMCGSLENVHEIHADFRGIEYATCFNGEDGMKLLK